MIGLSFLFKFIVLWSFFLVGGEWCSMLCSVPGGHLMEKLMCDLSRVESCFGIWLQ